MWEEQNIGKIFYLGVGLPSMLTVAASHVSPNPNATPTAPQTQAAPALRTPTGPVTSPGAPLGGSGVQAPKSSRRKPRPLFTSVFAAISVPGRTIRLVLPTEATGSFVRFEPTEASVVINSPDQVISVPSAATKFDIKGTNASTHDPIRLPSSIGASATVRLSAEKSGFYGFLYAVGAEVPPFELIVQKMEVMTPITDGTDGIVRELDLTAEAKPEPITTGRQRYYFTLGLLPKKALENLASVHYELVYDPNPLSLDGSPPAFLTHYEGWGCYETVVLTAFQKSASQPRAKVFNMCAVLGWQ